MQGLEVGPVGAIERDLENVTRLEVGLAQRERGRYDEARIIHLDGILDILRSCGQQVAQLDATVGCVVLLLGVLVGPTTGATTLFAGHAALADQLELVLIWRGSIDLVIDGAAASTGAQEGKGRDEESGSVQHAGATHGVPGAYA